MVQADSSLPLIAPGPTAPNPALPERLPRSGEEAAQLTERLQQAAQVTSRLCHDFGNLLTGVLGFSELAATHVSGGTVANQYLGEVRQVAVDGAAWLKKLAYFYRARPAEFTPANLYAAVADEESQTSGIATLQVDLPPDLPAVACDGTSLRHVLQELVNNAREATAASAPIAVTARVVELGESEARGLLGLPPAGRYVELVVADQGPGLSAAARARLFQDPFFSTKPRHRGLGLLTVCGIVQAFGGGLRVDSKNVGSTQVEVYFQAAG